MQAVSLAAVDYSRQSLNPLPPTICPSIQPVCLHRRLSFNRSRHLQSRRDACRLVRRTFTSCCDSNGATWGSCPFHVLIQQCWLLPPLWAGRGSPMGPIHAVGTGNIPEFARILVKSRAVLFAGSGCRNGMIARWWS